MKGTASYRGDDIEVFFVADMERSDYGVPGSPVWYEPLNIDFAEIIILGKTYEEKELPPRLVDDLLSLVDETTFELEVEDFE